MILRRFTGWPGLLLCLLAGPFPVHAALDYNGQVAGAWQQIIRLELDAGNTMLEAERRRHPENRLTLLFENYSEFLAAFISEEKTHKEAYDRHSSERYSALRDETENNPWKLYALGEMRIQSALLHIKFREFVSAVFDIRSAYALLKKNALRYPDFPLTGKALGLIHVAIGSVPTEYRWAAELAGLKGTVPQGMQELRTAMGIARDSLAPYREEILFYVATIQTSLGFEPGDMVATSRQVKPYAAINPLLNYSFINLCMRAGKSRDALDVAALPFGMDRFPFHFLDYKRGMLRLYQLDPDAESYFLRYLGNYKGKNFIKATWQKLAWLAFLRGQPEKYLSCLQHAAESGTTFTDEDKQADAEAKARELPHPVLLRARLLYDGGYLDSALACFRKTTPADFPRYRDQLDRTYRLGRIYDAMGQRDPAVEHYRRTLANGDASAYYYAANAALLLGNLYEREDRKDSAVFFYKKCLELRHHEYQNSIDQKARTGLERLGVDW
jgi:tetratricopeptide (TPR) repeat protein